MNHEMMLQSASSTCRQLFTPLDNKLASCDLEMVLMLYMVVRGCSCPTFMLMGCQRGTASPAWPKALPPPSIQAHEKRVEVQQSLPVQCKVLSEPFAGVD